MKTNTHYIEIIRGRKDQVSRRVDRIPSTFGRSPNGQFYTTVEMMMGDKLVRQHVNVDRIEKIKVSVPFRLSL